MGVKRAQQYDYSAFGEGSLVELSGRGWFCIVDEKSVSIKLAFVLFAVSMSGIFEDYSEHVWFE